jgi:hypothetical protein
MKNPSKIQLSAGEMSLITNSEWILTKNQILAKTKNLLANLQLEQSHILHAAGSKLPAEVLDTSAKISKGENYQGLPYLILDYPRLFNKENIFAIRTMFWWGNFFSITLHVSGNYKIELEQKVMNAFLLLKETGFHFCHNADQWDHHFETNNYKSLKELGKSDFDTLIKKSSFIKIAHKIPLQQWNEVEKILKENFKKLIEIVTG